jgi:hypothetical protein
MSRKRFTTIIVTTVSDEREPGALIQITHTHASSQELLAAIRVTVRAWAQTDEGQQARAEACGDFNWGDFAEWSTSLREKIPGVLDVAYLYPAVNGELAAVIVDHAELLMERESPCDD